ncbi:MAG TPA: putative baseplate assembly protein [Candidatus Limnocylindrales bacterium]|nr:putative baseplate assembly protein [Candidatus Limnocylindrales bacterium]
MNGADLSCRKEERREAVRAASLYGLDYVEVGSIENDDQRTLYVHFLGKMPPKFEKENLALGGGRRIRDVQITDLRVFRLDDPERDDYMEVDVNKSGDFSTYTLSVVESDAQGRPTGAPMTGFDQRYSKVCFSFKASCPSDLDCKPQSGCPPPERTEPDVNYLAKDYSSFKQLLLDRLSLIMPNWREGHVPDIGVTLVELLAYAGDYLSYYQDAVATEAYLGTARERISVRRHARLVDYRMHDGCNARAWLTLQTTAKQDLDLKQIYFITPFPSAPQDPMLAEPLLEQVPSSSYEVFQPRTIGAQGETITVHPEHNRISFYTWGDCECCLPVGATSATLVDNWLALLSNSGHDNPSSQTGAPSPVKPADVPASANKGKAGSGDASVPSSASAGAPKVSAAQVAPGLDDGPPNTERALKLKIGDVLIFEEIKGAKNGNCNDADHRHRQAVLLTKVSPSVDPLYHPYKDTFGPQYGQPVLEIEWAIADALTFPLCISSKAPPPKCDCMNDVSVARGNVILVDHGINAGEPLGTVPTQSTEERCPSCCTPAETQALPGLFRPVLSQQPLTFAEPLPPPCSASGYLYQDPRQCLPWISLLSIPPAPECAQPTVTVTESTEALLLAECKDNPEPTVPCELGPLFDFADIDDPSALARRLKNPGQDTAAGFLRAQLAPALIAELEAWDGSSAMKDPLRSDLLQVLNGLLETWTPLPDLLESGPDDRVFVAEIDNEGYAHLRFGNGLLGRQPEAGTAFRAAYRIGNSKAGNVGAETIRYIVFRNSKLSGITITPRNPFAAQGGEDAEPIDDVKQFAPYAFKAELERAVTADDYSTIAGDNARRWKERALLEASDSAICMQPFRPMQAVKSSLCWNGSWYTAQVALDPEDTETTDESLISEITDYISPFRRIGHDLLVRPAHYVPITLALTICVLPEYLRGHVESAVLDALSNRKLPDGRLGFFHPDNLSFGDGIYVSRLLAAVQSVPGVMDVTINELERFEISEPLDDVEGEEVPDNAVLELGPLEIARLDNDPNFPENGRLVLNVRGGR